MYNNRLEQVAPQIDELLSRYRVASVQSSDYEFVYIWRELEVLDTEILDVTRHIIALLAFTDLGIEKILLEEKRGRSILRIFYKRLWRHS